MKRDRHRPQQPQGPLGIVRDIPAESVKSLEAAARQLGHDPDELIDHAAVVRARGERP